MSGRIQHHIPQSFQRGFLISSKSKQTYVYRVDKHYVSNIDRIAAQRDFYSQPSNDGKKTLDDVITSYEDRLGHLLGTLRALEMGTAADAKIAAEVIAHLTPRGNSVRRMFGSGVTNLMIGVSEVFADKEAIVSLLGLAEAVPNITWNEHIASGLNKEEKLTQAIQIFLSQTKIPKASLDRMMFMFAKENMLGDTNPIPDQFQQAFSGLFSRIDEIVSDSHKKMLSNGLIAEPRMLDLEEFKWNIYPAPNHGAIMPDCIALGLDEEEGKFLPYIMTSTASAVVMPLTSQKLLVGVRPGSAVPDLSNFNDDASECSDEIFIAASSIHADLSDKIGKRWKGKMESIVQQALSSLLAYRNLQSKATPQPAPTPSSGYQLTFIGWSNNEDISHISGAVQSLIEKLRLWLDLTRLDGITFTSEFGKTLTDMERGFGISTNAEEMPDYIAQGAAALLVVRDGELKVRIVLSTEYAMSLIGDDMQGAGVTLHLLVAGLSLTHTVNKFEITLPGFLMEPVSENQHDPVLHCAMRKALRAYRYAYDSANFGAGDLFEQEFSNYLTHTFELTYAQINKAKEEHAIDGDHLKLFSITHAAITDLLIASARLIGHLDGTGKAPLPTPETSAGAAITARQLAGWVNAFAYDLQQFWKQESWAREDLYRLNIHIERLLWPFGIIIYPADSGQGTMILSFRAQ